MVEKKLSYNPNFAVHPGKSLRDEIEFFNISQIELSQRSGLSEKHISQIINGESPITPETSIKLERILSVPAEFWNNLQRNYDLTIARIEAEERLGPETEEARKFKCYSELVEVGCIAPAKTWEERVENLLKFFGLDSLSFVPKIQAIAFRQGKGKFDQYSLAAWLRCGELQAMKIKTEPYEKEKLKKLLPELKKLTANKSNVGVSLQKLCASVGVAVIFVPYFKGTKVNGATRWIGEKAVIQLNTKGSYSDIFWFTFFHEVGHIVLHGSKEKFIDYDGLEKDEKEKEADRFAADLLIPPAEYKKFLLERPINRTGVYKLAESLQINPSIVIGRLAHDQIISWARVGHLRDRLVIK